jgi:hypothetical protein
MGSNPIYPLINFIGGVHMILRIICFILGHKKPFEEIRCIEPLTIYELRCKRCGAEFGYNRRMKAILPLDEDLKYAHDVLLGVKP